LGKNGGDNYDAHSENGTSDLGTMASAVSGSIKSDVLGTGRNVISVLFFDNTE